MMPSLSDQIFAGEQVVGTRSSATRVRWRASDRQCVPNAYEEIQRLIRN